jgi:lipoprotein-releasing system ATP-binding protein
MKIDRPILTAEHLTKIFRSGAEEVIVFEDLKLEVRCGELVALVGESGAGKTTLLSLLAALDTPTRGEVYFEGVRVSIFPEEERAAYRNARIGYVWQMHHLLPEFTALENVMLPQLIGGGDFGAAGARGRELLAEVGLDKAAERRVENFQAANGSAWLWPGPWPTGRRSCWRMSRPATWIGAPRSASWTFSNDCTGFMD